MMRLSKNFNVLLLVGLAVAAPVLGSLSSENNGMDSEECQETSEIEHFPVVYSGKHEIVKILVPRNAMNLDENKDLMDFDILEKELILFFVEADTDKSGARVDKGLYILHRKKTWKLLENGRDAAYSHDEHIEVYFAASDGIYVYKFNDSEPTKYGKFDQGVISIAKENAIDVIYGLTDSRDLYKITDRGEKWTKVVGVDKAKEIVLDNSNNLYFYGDDLQPYVLADGVKNIQGLPPNPKSVRLTSPPPIIKDGLSLFSDDASYAIHADGTSKRTIFKMKKKKPTAFSMEGNFALFFAYNKKILAYNLIGVSLNTLLERPNNF